MFTEFTVIKLNDVASSVKVVLNGKLDKECVIKFCKIGAPRRLNRGSNVILSEARSELARYLLQ